MATLSPLRFLSACGPRYEYTCVCVCVCMCVCVCVCVCRLDEYLADERVRNLPRLPHLPSCVCARARVHAPECAHVGCALARAGARACVYTHTHQRW